MPASLLQSAPMKELKRHLETLPQREVVTHCMKLARYKHDNKDYLNYLLFESVDPGAFSKRLKEAVDEGFSALDKDKNLFFTKKGLRKILRMVTRYSRYASDPALTCEWHLYFCSKLSESGIPYESSPVVLNMYIGQLKKVSKLFETMHEDVRFDYQGTFEDLAGKHLRMVKSK
jgi:hypothetical protein